MSDDENDQGWELVLEEPEPEPLRGRPPGSKNLEHSPELLPPRPFLYTLDQIAGLICVELVYLKHRYCYYEGRTSGPHYPDFFLARNIAPNGRPVDWRVSERELARWLKRKGFRLHQRGWVT